MRVFACFLLILTLLAGGVIAYGYLGATMEIEQVSAVLTPATEALGTYREVVSQIQGDAFYGQIFREADFLMPEGYAFLTLTLRIKNNGFLPMDWIRVEAQADASDVAQLAEPRAPSLAGRNRAEFSITLLTRAGAETGRDLSVSYYVLGNAFTVLYAK